MDDVELQQIIANTNKLLAEQQKLMAEQYKFTAEAGKLRIDQWLAPVIVLFGAIGSLIASYSTISALLKYISQ